MASGKTSVQYLQRDARLSGIAEDVIHQVGNLTNTVAAGAFDFLHRFIDLAKTNPLWGAILGVVAVDLMTHKVDWFNWTHQEQQWVSTTTDANGNTSPVYGALVQAYDWLSGQHNSETQITVTVPGVISATCSVTVLTLILSGFGIAAAGEIIADFTKITSVAGGTPAPSLIAPTVTTLVEAGAATPVAIAPIALNRPVAGVA
jgi:hypothetical protein